VVLAGGRGHVWNGQRGAASLAESGCAGSGYAYAGRDWSGSGCAGDWADSTFPGYACAGSAYAVLGFHKADSGSEGAGFVDRDWRGRGATNAS